MTAPTPDGWNDGYATGFADAKPFTRDELAIISSALLYYLDELTPMARYREHIAREREDARELLAKVEAMS